MSKNANKKTKKKRTTWNGHRVVQRRDVVVTYGSRHMSRTPLAVVRLPTSVEDSLVRVWEAEGSRWGSCWSESRLEGGRKPPTSHDDWLVVFLAGVEGGWMWKPTNESRRLVGGGLGGHGHFLVVLRLDVSVSWVSKWINIRTKNKTYLGLETCRVSSPYLSPWDSLPCLSV